MDNLFSWKVLEHPNSIVIGFNGNLFSWKVLEHPNSIVIGFNGQPIQLEGLRTSKFNCDRV